MSKVKELLIILVVVVVAVISAIVGYNIYTQNQADKYDAVAVPYIKTIVPVVSNWNPETIKPLMAPEVLEKIPEEKFNQTMTWFSKLGALQSMAAPVFKKTHSEGKDDKDKQTIVIYDVDAKYENGDALITLQLIERGGSFELYLFNVSSSVLVE